MLPASQTDSRPRSRIGRYVVTGRLGKGGMGMVYRGLDEVLEREVAVKTLTIEGTFDDESRRRFEIEAKAAARLQHPNILTVFELGEDRGVPYIAMELLPGADLEALMRSGDPMLLSEKLDVVIQVCRGLAFAHEHKIVHRDIKPSNIRLLDDGTAKIMDFGIAKLSGTALTKSGMMVGTVHYMSPEQIRAQPLDGRSDVFSVGVILYEMLSGRRPFIGADATQVLYKIVTAEPPPLEVDLGEWGPRLQAILAKALAKDQAARFSSASAMADELSGALAEMQRARSTSLLAGDHAAVNTARRLLKEGRVEESARQLRELLQRHPESLEARRALRAATRETQRRQRPPEPETQEFPELEATFRSAPTRMQGDTSMQPETAVQPTVHYTAVVPPTSRPAPAPAPAAAPTGAPMASPTSASRSLLVAGAGGLVVLALITGVLLLRGRNQPEAEAKAAPVAPISVPPAALSPAPVSAAASVNVSVSSDPSGARVSVDGRAVEGMTPLKLSLDPRAAHVLQVSREGHSPQEVRLPSGALPPEVKLTLEPAAAPGSVSVTSSYPLDVTWKGKVLAKGQVSPRVSVPAGRQALTIQSPTYFLKSTVNVDVRSGAEAEVAAPTLGRISIRASPDNCEVFIEGVFVDYPPILDRQIAAGPKTVAFKWPDGTRREEQTEIRAGGLSYVTGRKE